MYVLLLVMLPPVLALLHAVICAAVAGAAVVQW